MTSRHPEPGLVTSLPTSSATRLTVQVGFAAAALLILGLAAIAWLLFTAARNHDAIAREASQATVHGALRAVERDLGRTVGDYANWDEAMDNLHVGFDPAWARTNIGPYAHETLDIEDVLVLRPDAEVVFRYSAHPKDGHLFGLEADLPRLKAIVAGAVAAATDEPPSFTGILRYSEHVHLIAASRIAYIREDAPEEPVEQSSVLMFSVGLDEVIIPQLASEYGLADLRLEATVSAAGPGEAWLPLADLHRGNIVGFLVWQPERPGRKLLESLTVPALALLAVLLLSLLLVTAAARRAGRALDREQRAVASARDELEAQVAARTATLRRTEARLQSIFRNTAVGIFQVDLEGRYISANPAMARMFGFASAEELIALGTDPTLADAALRAEFIGAMRTFGMVRDFFCPARRRDGSAIWTSQNTRTVHDEDGRTIYYEGVIIDVTDRHRAEQQLLHDALHDALTGLPNRTLFQDRLDRAMARCRDHDAPPYAVLFIDCDRFKLINDSLGHHAGDRLLIALVQRLAKQLRRADTLARLGGDEFAVLLENASTAAATALADRLHEACRAPIHLEQQRVFVTLSIGVAVGHPAYESAGEVLRDADIAMYQAKANGRATTALFERGMHLSVVGRLRLEGELREALAREQFVLHFQPMVTLAGGALAGFEALVRWRHPERGLIYPDAFLPVVEETGLIEPLGDWVLRAATRRLVAWRRAFGGEVDALSISVNLSALQLRRPDIVDHVAAVLAETGLPPDRLELEITESAIIADPGDTRLKLAGLDALGIRLGIDDFGTGYSSLSQLHTFPFHTLKIDRSFVSRLTEGREHAAVIRTILLLAENLRLATVAEGVETTLQRDWLRAHHCTVAQGFLYSRPIDADAASALIARALAGRPLGDDDATPWPAKTVS